MFMARLLSRQTLVVYNIQVYRRIGADAVIQSDPVAQAAGFAACGSFCNGLARYPITIGWMAYDTEETRTTTAVVRATSS